MNALSARLECDGGKLTHVVRQMKGLAAQLTDILRDDNGAAIINCAELLSESQ